MKKYLDLNNMFLKHIIIFYLDCFLIAFLRIYKINPETMNGIVNGKIKDKILIKIKYELNSKLIIIDKKILRRFEKTLRFSDE